MFELFMGNSVIDYTRRSYRSKGKNDTKSD